MKNHLLEKLYPNSTRGTPLKIFRILKNLTEKKLRGFQDLERQNNSKKIKLSNGAPAHGAPLLSSRLENSNYIKKIKIKVSNGAPVHGASLQSSRLQNSK